MNFQQTTITIFGGHTMKILMIGGTGTISSAITRQLAAEGHELWLLNRGNRSAGLPQNIKLVTADIHEHPEDVAAKLGNETFDAVCEFIGFLPEQVERDEAGFVRTDAEMCTCVPGIFAAGDIRSKHCRQVSTAVGDGATAATAANEQLP